jgi:hypothetical protein
LDVGSIFLKEPFAGLGLEKKRVSDVNRSKKDRNRGKNKR